MTASLTVKLQITNIAEIKKAVETRVFVALEVLRISGGSVSFQEISALVAQVLEEHPLEYEVVN